MKRKIKPILAAVSAAVMCAALAGCESNDQEITEKDLESAVSKLESYMQGSDKASVNSAKSSGSSKPEENPEPEEITYAPTDEIKNADFNSGLVQMNNEVFRQGGYITVEELVEKYKDAYDITYKDGPYEERKDYLLEYKKPSIETDWGHSVNSNYTLLLTPKLGGDPSAHAITVKIGNATSPDEKITLDKAIVLSLEVCPINDRYRKNHISIWGAHGIYLSGKNFNNNDYDRWEKPDGITSDLDGYTQKQIEEYLDGLGVKAVDFNAILPFDEYETFRVKDKPFLYAVGETNLFGARPIFEYSFRYDSDTDKLSEVYCQILKFME